MVILFRPYLSQDEAIKEEIIERVETENCDNIKNNKSALQCKWMGCGNWFDNLDLLSSHVSKEHTSPGDKGLFYCKWNNCNRGSRGFNARYKMLVHVRTHTNEKPHQCDQCNKSFSRAENLKIHCRSHTGEKPYICIIPGCGKAYSNSSDRFKHSRTHSIDKPYACKVPGCSKRYTDPSSLRKHVKTYKHYDAHCYKDGCESDEKNLKSENSVDSVVANDILTRLTMSEKFSEDNNYYLNAGKDRLHQFDTTAMQPQYESQKEYSPSNYQYKVSLDKVPHYFDMSSNMLYQMWCKNNPDHFYSWHLSSCCPRVLYNKNDNHVRSANYFEKNDKPLDLTVHSTFNSASSK